MVSTSTQRFLFSLLGVIYLIGGAAALVNATFAWHSGLTGSPYFYVAFAVMYLALSYLFFNRQWWLVPLIAAILLANAGLWGYRWYATHAWSWVGIVALVVNILVLWYVAAVRRRLDAGATGRAVAGAALLAGAVAYYMVISSYLL